MSRPWLLGALFASLALNVFIGGAFAGAHLAKSQERPAHAEGQRGHGGGGGGGGGPMMAAVRALPPEAQAAWRERGAEFAQTQGPKFREARQLARQTMSGIGAEPLDVDATLAALKRARTMEYENRLAMDQRLVTFAATLPPDQRKAFAEALSRPGHRDGPNRKGGDQKGPDRQDRDR